MCRMLSVYKSFTNRPLGQGNSSETAKGSEEEAFLKCTIVNETGASYDNYAPYIFTIIYNLAE